MPKYSERSHSNLTTCDGRLIHIFTNVIQQYDHSVVFGYRPPEVQFELYKKGRELVDGKWEIKDKRKVVTDKDGYNKLSYHNFLPSLAIDVVPFPGYYDAPEEKFFELAGVIKTTARFLGYDIHWGYDLWEWDMAHWQLEK